MKLINSQSRDHPEWPTVTVIRVEHIDNLNIPTDEPFTHKIYLDCGHWCINRWGNKFESYEVGDKLGCRTCYMRNNAVTSN